MECEWRVCVSSTDALVFIVFLLPYRIYGEIKLCIYVYGQCLPTCPFPSGVHLPLGAGGRGVKNSKKWGVVSFVQWTATISIFLSASKCGSICMAQTCAHSGVKPSRSGKAFLQGGPKSSKKFRIIHHFQALRPYISETIKNRSI